MRVPRPSASRKLIPPKGEDVRPTSDRARETLFAILGDVSDLSVLDLFAGTGALGDRGDLARRRLGCAR